MVCDLNAWRTVENIKPIFDFVKRVAGIIINEQDVIAMYFKDKLSFLPIRWNMTTFYFLRKPIIFDKYLKEIKQAQFFPGIIHYAAPIKPWFRDCMHPYRDKYRKFLNISEWPSKPMTYFNKLSTVGRIKFNIRWFLNSINLKNDPFFPCLKK